LTCAKTAENGNLNILKWVRENGCPWNSSTCIKAASGGHLEILKWAHENGCPWDKEGCIRHAKKYPEIISWIKKIIIINDMTYDIEY